MSDNFPEETLPTTTDATDTSTTEETSELNDSDLDQISGGKKAAA